MTFMNSYLNGTLRTKMPVLHTLCLLSIFVYTGAYLLIAIVDPGIASRREVPSNE